MFGLNYMAWLALFVWVGVPVVALLTGALLWRQSRAPLWRSLAIISSAAILSAPMLVSNRVKAHYDQQVLELCATDGGVRVFETVTLPANKFNQFGQPNFHIPVSPYNKLKDIDEYYFEWEVSPLKRGNPKLERSQSRIFRRNDNKVLGESVAYFRRGGDLPGPWSESSFVCPEPRKYKSLESSVFVKGEK